MLKYNTFADFLASAQPIADLWGNHVEFPAEDSPGTPMPAVLFATGDDPACALYVFAASEGDEHVLAIGNWEQKGSLEACAASLFAYYVFEHANVQELETIELPPSTYLGDRTRLQEDTAALESPRP